MKYFGTVKSFDITQGRGQIEQETGGNDLPFDKTAIAWGEDPTLGQRLSYDLGIDPNRQRCAVNLQTI